MKQKLKLNLLCFLHLFGTGSFWAYISAFALNVKGFSSSEVGILTAVYSSAFFFGLLFFGMLCDRLKTHRKVYIVCMTLALGLSLAIFFSKSVLTMTVLYGIYGFIDAPMQNIMEAWILKRTNDDTGKYGQIRSWGALSFGGASLIVGLWIRRSGAYTPMIYANLTAIILGILIAFTVPDSHFETGGAKDSGFKFSEVGAILKNPIMIFTLLTAFFLGFTSAPINNLKIMIIENLGGDTGTQGIEAMIGSILQFGMYYLAPMLRYVSAKKMLLINSILVVLGAGFLFLANGIPLFLAGSWLLYIDFAILQVSLLRVICENVDFAYQTTGVGIMNMVYGSISGIIAMLISGTIAENYGIKVMLLIALASGVIGLVISAVQLGLKNKTKGGNVI